MSPDTSRHRIPGTLALCSPWAGGERGGGGERGRGGERRGRREERGEREEGEERGRVGFGGKCLSKKTCFFSTKHELQEKKVREIVLR